MKVTQKQLKEMVKKAVVARLNEAVDDEPSEVWVKYLKDVDDFINETIKKSKDLADKAEELQKDAREKDETANPLAARRGNIYDSVADRLGFLKGLTSKLSQKYEAWKTQY